MFVVETVLIWKFSVFGTGQTKPNENHASVRLLEQVCRMDRIHSFWLELIDIKYIDGLRVFI